jgi:RNA polymerase sigma factor (sigma-70 family)
MALEGLSEAELARGCRGGDPNAWREFVRRYTPLVYRLSYRMLRSAGEAEDVSQEVFLRMFRSFDTYDPTRPLDPWIGRTTYHACLRKLESVARKREQANDPAALEIVADGQALDPEQIAAGQEATTILSRAMEGLSAQDRALLDLRYREGLSDAEVSEATGMPINTVKTRIFRARGRLREWLGPLLKGGEP